MGQAWNATRLDSGGESAGPGRLLPQSRVDRDLRMTKILRENQGVIPLARLWQLGFSKKEVRGLVSHGDLRRIYRGVYADGRNRPTDDAHLKAALMAVGEGAWLAGKSAAAVWGLRHVSLATIELGICASSTPRHEGLRVIRSAKPLHRSELASRRGLQVSSVPRMLIELAASSTAEELEALIDESIRRSVLDLLDLEATIRRHTRRPGIQRLKTAVADYRPKPRRKSGLERSFDRWLLQHPEIEEPQRNVHLGNWELDCYWPDRGLVLELDGRPYHVVARDIERDRRKDAWLQLHGLRILRVTDNRWTVDRGGVHSDLMALLALGIRDSGGENRPGGDGFLPQSR